MTVSEIYKNTTENFKDAGVPELENDARMLMQHYLGISRNDIFVHGDGPIEDDSKLKDFEEAVCRRCKREPLQYIIGETCFMGFDFSVNENVLIPRPDTEILVEELMKDLHGGSRILDMCTGSGCILISLMNYSNDCEGVGVDISEKALSVARENAKRLAPDKKISFLCGNLFEALENGTDDVREKYDIIVSNPPYIKSEVCETLMPEVKDHEPRIALDGTEDGLYFYREITAQAGKYLDGGGKLAFEIGYDQGEAVRKMMEEHGYIDVEVIKDYSNLDRVVIGIKRV